MGCSVSKSDGSQGELTPVEAQGINEVIREQGLANAAQDGAVLSVSVFNRQLDPRLPLNERQLYGIKKSWKAISRNMDTTGVTMFVRMFETNMDLKNQFQKFRDLKDVSDLRQAKGFTEHAMLVMCTIDEAINNLDDVPYVIEMLRKTGQTHKRFPGFKPENFYEIEEPFLTAVSETLGDRFSTGMQVAYKRIIYFILDTLVGGFKS